MLRVTLSIGSTKPSTIALPLSAIRRASRAYRGDSSLANNTSAKPISVLMLASLAMTAMTSVTAVMDWLQP